MCAFSVSSAGMRCVLEKYNYGEEVRLQCRTSQVKVADIAGWVESDRCVEACGVDRSSVGISSDSLMERQFLERLCSAPCYGGCPNIVDLYFNLAAAEGKLFPPPFLSPCSAPTSTP
uniref:PAR1 protein n=1 Tax=Nymphaea colorata TaxID=210225 RepID=A0A5K1CLE8_9MAGN